MFGLLNSPVAWWCLAVVCWFGVCRPASAQLEYRKWTSTSGTTIEARCISNLREDSSGAEMSKVRLDLEKRDGAVITVVFSQLSEADQRWLMQHFFSGDWKKPALPEPGQSSFVVVTEKDVGDPAKLLYPSRRLEWQAKRLKAHSRFVFAVLRDLHAAGIKPEPEWVLNAAYWSDRYPRVMALAGQRSLGEAVVHASKGGQGWWPAFKEPKINQLLQFLAQNNQTRDGLRAYKRVACRTEITPTIEELERINTSMAYAELEARLHVPGKADETLELVFESINRNELAFIHGNICYLGELGTVDREVRDRYEVKRSDAWCIRSLRVIQKADPRMVPKLLDRMRNEQAVLLIGDGFGKMFTVSPEFLHEPDS